jgi:hypothetical protein
MSPFGCDEAGYLYPIGTQHRAKQKRFNLPARILWRMFNTI